MKKNKKSGQKGINFILLTVWLFSFLLHGSVSVYAAENVDTGEKCSIRLEIPAAYQEELKTEILSVRLYRIAEITEYGTYRGRSEYEDLHVEKLSDVTTAEELGGLANKAASLLGVENWEAVPAAVPDYEFLIQNNEGVQQELETGLYLVCVKPVTTGNAVYQAMPYIISLPTLLETETDGIRDLQWMYDLKVDLKLGCKSNILDTQPQPTGVVVTEPSPEPVTEPVSLPVQRKNRTGDDAMLIIAFGGTITAEAFFLLFAFLDRRKQNVNLKGKEEKV